MFAVVSTGGISQTFIKKVPAMVCICQANCCLANPVEPENFRK